MALINSKNWTLEKIKYLYKNDEIECIQRTRFITKMVWFSSKKTNLFDWHMKKNPATEYDRINKQFYESFLPFWYFSSNVEIGSEFFFFLNIVVNFL